MKIALRIVLLVVLIVLLFIRSRPAHFHVERSTVVAAVPQVVYGRIADFHAWGTWSPWAKLDPAMKATYSGAAAGTGAVYEWTGNDKVGQGRMTIVDALPARVVTIRLEFIKPFASVCTSVFTLVPQGKGTQVTWAMNGDNNFLAKVMSLFMSMDKTVGADFERGLASLKGQAESAPPAPADSAATPVAAGSAAARP